MKRTALSIFLALIATSNHAYTPIVYINGQPHNAGLAHGVTVLQDLMDYKSKKFAPSFQAVSSTICSQQDDDLEYAAAISALTYHQKLDGFAQGLFFQAIAPISVVSNKIDTRIATPSNVSDLNMFIQNSGIADITLLFGYKFFDAQACQVAINIDAIFPTNKDNEINRQLIPALGNGGHIALGISLDGNVRVIGNDNHNVTLASEVQFHHLLQTEKQPLLGLTRATRATINQALIGYAIQLIPTHNITVADITISSGNILDATASITYNYHKLFVNLGCSYHFRDETNIAHAGENFLNETFDKFQLNGKTVKLENIDTIKQTATMPECHLLTINADIGLACKEWIMPVLEIPYAFTTSLGAHATALHSNNTAAWGITIKSGFSF